jgi:hypothetical protein
MRKVNLASAELQPSTEGLHPEYVRRLLNGDHLGVTDPRTPTLYRTYLILWIET